MKKFGLGMLTGVVGTIASLAGVAKVYHKIAIEPIEKEEAQFEATEIRGARKAGNSHTAR
ncbi:DUF3042 family protein [Weissella koreensis]|uniref:DUF3042 family protein n=1 Tax=Weissella koreensis TaxID=165096 RepID=UPI000217495B|nr:DUF3042 family protein [Weissella koreensis]AEJ23813.1 hypothetical protein WKK_04705 [Weissella koreensis KACC 15510]AVH75440.1 DUF3042 domain-containing protein [Weissella koreensis]EJF34418.1 hypothetical protein JC2156_12580 [Weissella koreensis KCTC 3621]MCZ9311284.1 DUF3042 family protein [Weissella koreensis]QGN20664.1 DUF3042 family protein [Weissella koreensis]